MVLAFGLHDEVIIFMHSLTERLQGGPSTQETLASEDPTSLPDHALQCWLRYLESKDGQDLDDAIAAGDNSVEHMPDAHPLRGRDLALLGSMLTERYRLSNTHSDNDRGILALESCVSTPQYNTRGGVFDILGMALLARFKHAGQLDDVEKAISAHEDAVRLTPDGDADKPRRLLNLGNSFSRRFEHLGQLDDVEKAISAQEDAVRLTPDGHANKPPCLTNLGNSFLPLFEHLGQLDDVEKAISAHEDAVRLTPDGHANKPRRLTNLGNSFLGRFDHLGQLDDVEKAISAQEDAVRLTPDGHANKPKCLMNLGN